ncbi:MAG: hypothetical protein IJE18_01310, partial [Bacteroidaceae bacterium]|nr:hypothetical protein [Bacteroidaceae bacterium]
MAFRRATVASKREECISRRATTLVARASLEAMNMQMCYFLVRSGQLSHDARGYKRKMWLRPSCFRSEMLIQVWHSSRLLATVAL